MTLRVLQKLHLRTCYGQEMTNILMACLRRWRNIGKDHYSAKKVNDVVYRDEMSLRRKIKVVLVHRQSTYISTIGMFGRDNQRWAASYVGSYTFGYNCCKKLLAFNSVWLYLIISIGKLCTYSHFSCVWRDCCQHDTEKSWVLGNVTFVWS